MLDHYHPRFLPKTGSTPSPTSSLSPFSVARTLVSFCPLVFTTAVTKVKISGKDRSFPAASLMS